MAWDEDAVRYVMTETRGHPYLLQAYGQATWNAAEGATLTYDDARVGVVSGRVHLDTRLYRPQWERATRAQRAYLQAMAVDACGQSQSGEIAARLGKTLTTTGSFRDSLIKKSLIYSPQQGTVAYVIPGMADFIARQSRPWPVRGAGRTYEVQNVPRDTIRGSRRRVRIQRRCFRMRSSPGRHAGDLHRPFSRDEQCWKVWCLEAVRSVGFAAYLGVDRRNAIGDDGRRWAQGARRLRRRWVPRPSSRASGAHRCGRTAKSAVRQGS